MRFFSIINHIFFLIMTPSALRINFSHVILTRNIPVIGYANAGTIVSRLLCLLVGIIMRPKRDQQMKEWLESVRILQLKYFSRFSQVPRDTKLRKWLYLNIFVTLMHNINIMFIAWHMVFSGKWRILYDIYIFGSSIILQHCVMLYHAILLCYLHESFSILNHQLRNNEFNNELTETYFRLCSLWKQLNTIFNPINFWIQLCLIITNSMVGFVGVLILFKPQLDFKSYTYLLGSSFYILICIHLHIYFMICDHMIKTPQKTLDILMDYTCRDYNQEVGSFI